MEELDDEFGVGDLVSEKLKKDREEQYTAKHLRGMRVEHSTDHFRQVCASQASLLFPARIRKLNVS
jgi:hypothetical protein